MSYDFIYFHVVLCDLILLLHLVSLWPFTTHHHAIAQVRKELLAYLYARKACSIQIQSRCIKYTCTILYYPLLVSSSPSVQPIPEPAVTAVRCDLQNESRRRRGAIRQLPWPITSNRRWKGGRMLTHERWFLHGFATVSRFWLVQTCWNEPWSAFAMLIFVKDETRRDRDRSSAAVFELRSGHIIFVKCHVIRCNQWNYVTIQMPRLAHREDEAEADSFRTAGGCAWAHCKKIEDVESDESVETQLGWSAIRRVKKGEWWQGLHSSECSS